MSIALQNKVVFHKPSEPAVLSDVMDADTLVRTHLKYVEKIARGIHARMSTALPLEDLTQIGLIALIEAAAVFEMRGEAKFLTYASQRIRGAIIDELRHSATISRRALRDRRAFAATSARLAGQLGRTPGDEEMAAALGLGLAAYRKAVLATRSLRYESLDATYADNIWFRDPSPDAFDNVATDRQQSALSKAIGNLPEREAMILQYYFIDDLDLEQVGKVMGISAARVCQMKRAALQKMRRLMKGWE